MKPAVLLPVVLVVATAASYVVARLVVSPPVAAREAGSPEASDLDRLERAVSGMQQRQESLTKSIEDLRAEMAMSAGGSSRVPVGETEDAVARALAARTASDGTVAAAAAESAAPKKPADAARSALADLLADDLTEADRLRIWKEAMEGGYGDQLVALFEKRAAENPGVADMQLDLGRAYLQKVFRAGGNGPEAGLWATKADKAFEAALAIDDHHWGSRFAKAVSLSFWPPVFGKQNEAIRNFETLIQQQSQVVSEPRHAQTWLLLGNMYQQIGHADQALATWQKGLGLFPNDAALRQQIASAQSH
jgi:tetratricopeptide (TPR) repeat protein